MLSCGSLAKPESHAKSYKSLVPWTSVVVQGIAVVCDIQEGQLSVTTVCIYQALFYFMALCAVNFLCYALKISLHVAQNNRCIGFPNEPKRTQLWACFNGFLKLGLCMSNQPQ